MALIAGVAHAGSNDALKKRGYTHVARLAKGKVTVVSASDPEGTTHLFLVDSKGHLLDTGESPSMRGMVTVTVSPFFGKKSLSDVDVAWSWSNGMGVDDGDTHYIVRA